MTNSTVHPVLQRYAPLACGLILMGAALLTCFQIIGYGYLPGGDARRHVARAFTDKPFREIVVMKPFYVVDQSQGWEGLLRVTQRLTGCGEDGLMGFSVVLLLAFLLCAPMAWLGRPEAWLAAVLAQLIAIPELAARWTQARPFLLTEGMLICLLLAWAREGESKPSRLKLAASVAAMTISVWMHGAWYLWVLLPVAFVLARRWRAAAWLTVCWLGGVVLGAALTGHPWVFLVEQLQMAAAIRAEHLPARLLVGEFQPHQGEFASVAALGLVYLWGHSRKIRLPVPTLQPAFWLALMGWTLGFIGDRFWADWGLPAGLVWMALQFDEIMDGLWSREALTRVVACGAIGLPLMLDASNNFGERYTASLRETYVDGAAPELKGWMPGTGGIFYSAHMRFFYNTFYRNPQADWRYIIGFEPALMPEDDLKICRNIQLSNYSAESYEPWIKKLQPMDRLELESADKPNLPELEWKRAGGYVWIGRLPANAVTEPKLKS